jgi:hypothetical protein
MLYRFKSKATGDVVMLEANGKQVLEILGKDPSGPGILLYAQMPAAIEALQAAVAHDEAEQARRHQEAEAAGDAAPEPDRVSLRTRVTPFIEMLRHCMREECEVVWGV